MARRVVTTAGLSKPKAKAAPKAKAKPKKKTKAKKTGAPAKSGGGKSRHGKSGSKRQKASRLKAGWSSSESS